MTIGHLVKGTRIPLPPRLAARPTIGAEVVGRDAELADLDEAVGRVLAGAGQEVLLVSGEAGQGKTTLVSEAARAAFAQGACVLFGHCEEDLATPYQLFAEAFGHFVAHADEGRLRRVVDGRGSEWVRLVPALADRMPDLPPSRATDPDTERYLLFASALEMIGALADDRPVVLVFDDLQWADSGSLALLRHLIAAGRDRRVLVLGTFRDHELPQFPSVRETLVALWRYPGVSRIELDGLGPAGVLALLESVAGHELEGSGLDLATRVRTETDGNAFFVTEVLRHLRDTGVVERAPDGRWSAVPALDLASLPASVREVVGGRVARLGPDAQHVLATAAVIGQDFDLGLLESACQVDPASLVDVIEATAGASLVHDTGEIPGRCRFAHSLVQRTLYEELRPARRASLHERVARALEQHPGDRPGIRAGELARHWIHAPRPAGLAPAIRASREAGDDALASLAPEDALPHFRTALELCDEAGERDPLLLVDLAIGLGTAQGQSGDPSYRTTLLAAANDAARIGDVNRMVRACLANDRGFYSAVGATDHEKVEVLELTLELLPPSHPDRALVLATLCSELAHGSPLERRRALADEAIAIAEATGDDAVIVRVLSHLHVPLQVPSMLETTEARAHEAIVRAERIGDPVLQFWAAQWCLQCAARRGDVEEVDRYIAVHGELAEQLRQPVFTWSHCFAESLRAQIAGDTDLAEQFAGEARAIGVESGQPDATTIFGAQFNIVCGQRGTQSELAPLIEEMAANTPDIPRTFFLSLLAKAHVEGDRFEQALPLLAEFADASYELPLDYVWLTGMVDFAEAAIECCAPAYAGPLFEHLEPWADQLPATGASALGPVSHYLGGLATVLGRLDEADTYFSRAAAMNHRLGAAFFGARTDLLWARMLLQRSGPGDAERACALLREAHRVAAARGYAVVERRAAALLERVG